MSTQETENPDLEPHVPMPRGGVAARCQRVKKDGAQCKKPARTGYRVCGSHGAGYAKRERAGTRQKPGRPVTHGKYSITGTKSFGEAEEEVAALEDALTSSDRDLIALKAALMLKLNDLQNLAPKVQHAETELEALASEAAELLEDVTPDAARLWVRRLAQLAPILTALERITGQVVHVALSSITAHKTRAETAAKLSETEGITIALRVIQVARKIVGTLGTPDLVDAYELALARELYGPLRVEPPDRDRDPEDL